jgi:hypothetical protein
MSKTTPIDTGIELQNVTPKKDNLPNAHYRPVRDIALNEKNPRWIPDDAFERLKASIRSFPQMLEIRPVVVDENGIILGGNMRYRAAKAIGLDTIPVIEAADLTEDQKNEFIVKDNVAAGRWDWDSLSSNFSADEILSWGIDIDYGKQFDAGFYDQEADDESGNNYTRKIETPIYDPSEERPDAADVCDTSKYEALLAEIEADESIDDSIRLFLRLAATRHIRFNYDLAADLYSHSNEIVRRLMEASALVIVDYDQAIERGFVKLTKAIEKARQTDGK